jgi:hypothetical protein
VLLTEVFRRALRSLGIRIKGGLILFQEFLLNSDVVISDAKHNHAIFRFALLLWERVFRLAKVALTGNTFSVRCLTTEREFRY